MKTQWIYGATMVMALALNGPSLAGNGGGKGAGGAGFQMGGAGSVGQQMSGQGRSGQAMQQDRDRERYQGAGDRETGKAKTKRFGEASGEGDLTRTRQQDRVRDPATDN